MRTEQQNKKRNQRITELNCKIGTTTALWKQATKEKQTQLQLQSQYRTELDTLNELMIQLIVDE
jgi:uncharacterized protein YgiM (DUF1202 family)